MENFETSLHISMFLWACFMALSHFYPHSVFSSTEGGLPAPFLCQYLPLPIVNALFCIPSATKAIWKGFVVVVVSDTVVLRKSIQIIVNQIGNKYFSSSLPFPCHCIPHCCFTYSVNKECCQTLRLKKGNIIAVSSWSIQSRGEPCTESESQWKCIGVTILSIFQVHQKS